MTSKVLSVKTFKNLEAANFLQKRDLFFALKKVKEKQDILETKRSIISFSINFSASDPGGYLKSREIWDMTLSKYFCYSKRSYYS